MANGWTSYQLDNAIGGADPIRQIFAYKSLSYLLELGVAGGFASSRIEDAKKHFNLQLRNSQHLAQNIVNNFIQSLPGYNGVDSQKREAQDVKKLLSDLIEAENYDGFVVTHLAHLDSAVQASSPVQQQAAYETLVDLMHAVIPEQYRSPVFNHVESYAKVKIGSLEQGVLAFAR